MRYTYRCDVCLGEVPAEHPMNEVGKIVILCPYCPGGPEMRIKIEPPAHIITSTVGGRSILGRDRPSNQEYQAYKKWEDAGGQPGTPEHKEYLARRGYD